MWFDPFSENLFGASLWVWVGTAAVWAGVLLFFHGWPDWLKRDRTHDDPPSDPP